MLRYLAPRPDAHSTMFRYFLRGEVVRGLQPNLRRFNWVCDWSYHVEFTSDPYYGQVAISASSVRGAWARKQAALDTSEIYNDMGAMKGERSDIVVVADTGVYNHQTETSTSTAQRCFVQHFKCSKYRLAKYSYALRELFRMQPNVSP